MELTQLTEEEMREYSDKCRALYDLAKEKVEGVVDVRNLSGPHDFQIGFEKFGSAYSACFVDVRQRIIGVITQDSLGKAREIAELWKREGKGTFKIEARYDSLGKTYLPFDYFQQI